MRIGLGYDVHELSSDRNLILCGVNIVYEKGLLGHSDADVALHALCDALLGAAALGDIGKFFPDNDPKYKNADSLILLQTVYKMVREHGYSLENADITIIAQQPKLAPYIYAMRKNVSQALNVDIDFISVKATTEEHLGFTGELKGIKALAAVIIK